MVVTNTVGVVFTAALLSVSDAGPTFIFPDNGTTNAFVWTQLSPASRKAVCSATRFTPVPPELTGVFKMAKAEQRRLAALESDGRLALDEVAKRRGRLVIAFRRACQKHRVSQAETEALLRRVMSEKMSD